MKTTYAKNNTKSLLLIVGSLVLALVLFAAILGLSDKPKVSTVAMQTSDGTPLSVDQSTATETNASADDADTGDADAEADEVDPQISSSIGTSPPATLVPIADDSVSVAAPTSAAQPTAAPESSTTAPAVTDSAASAAVAPVPTAVPEIAAAVEPLPTSLPASDAQTSATDQTSTAIETDAAEPQVTASTARTAIADPSGTVEGNFFTRADEDEGAVVARNNIELSFDESGGGSFRGVLDITYADGSQVQIDMGGAFVYAPVPPQVMATVNGTFRRDAVDDLDDASTERGDLSITSFVSGSGALCAPDCFGFTFPPPGT